MPWLLFVAATGTIPAADCVPLSADLELEVIINPHGTLRTNGYTESVHRLDVGSDVNVQCSDGN